MHRHAEPRTGPWTVADIGGTRTRLAFWSPERGLQPERRLKNDEYSGPLDVLNGWFAEHASGSRRLLLALAMPIGGARSTLTNRAWRFEPADLAAALELDELLIVNDFAAAAAGVDALPGDALQRLNPASCDPPPGVRLVIGPGTGLGVAAVAADDPPRVLASEAGHVTFASGDPVAARLNAEGRARWGRVSWERVLSGDGLSWLHAVVTGREARMDPAAVAHAAAQGDRGAVDTVRLFSKLLGEFAGDICLAFQALEGVALGGGVLHGLRARFDAQAFLQAFAAKGRLAEPLRNVPVLLATGHELGLHGAARYLAGECRMPAMEWKR